MVDQDILQEFLTESREHLGKVEDDILALEKNPGDVETVNRLFRSLHTIKGAASFLAMKHVTNLAHALENIVGKVRSGQLVPNVATVEALLKGADRLEFLIEHHDEKSLHGEEEIALLDNSFASAAKEPKSQNSKVEVEDRNQTEASLTGAKKPQKSPSNIPGDPREPQAPISKQSQATSGSETGVRIPVKFQELSPADATVRISVGLLDKMMNLASELVLVRNQNMQAVDNRDLEQLSILSQRLNVVTSDLQANVMQTRMRPVSHVFHRFTRIVRDLAHTVNKEIHLEIIGTDVELDKNIIEAIGDPLSHLLRNAVDHGIESTAKRTAKGKPLIGNILLKAEHRTGQVNIVIHDDGQGMDPNKLIEAALKKELITKAQAKTMSDRDAFNLVFLPGFTLAESITHLSGRGVGMDVVKEAFGKFGGTIDIDSRIDKGTTFTIRLPLTVAIVPALIVSSADVCFAIPQVNIKELVWLKGDEVFKKLRIADEREVFRLRGKLLPVLRLSELMGLETKYVDPKTGKKSADWRDQRPDRRQSEGDSQSDDKRAGPDERRVSLSNSVFIVVIKMDDEQYALLVDNIVDTEEIVVKEVHNQLKTGGAFVGTTVLGDGRIALILDVADLARVGDLRFIQSDSSMVISRSSAEAVYTLLLFDIGGRQRYAAPLCMIKRVEEVTSDCLKKINDKDYLTFRDEIIPLVRLEQALGRIEYKYPDDLFYVIIPKSARPFGIPASNIRDTMEVFQQLDSDTISHEGVVGSILIDGDLVLVLDLFKIMELVEPGWNEVPGRLHTQAPRILLVEDSKFFASMLMPPLRSKGVEIVHVQNGQAALDRLEIDSFDFVVSDLEMPVMGGFEFARRVRNNPKFASLPLVGMSSMTDPTIESQALAAGFDVFRSKLNNALLVEEILGRLPKREAS